MELVVKTLRELYEAMQLPVESLDETFGFTFHYLKETFKELPFRSVPFRPNYFSFLFIKNGAGKYTIDDHVFDVDPMTVYFTNPGNYRVFEWHNVDDTCLITFNEAYLKEYVHQDVYRDFSFLLTETVEPRKLSPEQFESLEQIYDQIHCEHLGQSIYKNKIIGGLIVILLLKIKEYFFQDYNPIYEGNRNSQIVKTFKQNLEQHFTELVTGRTAVQLRVQDYADKQSLHVNYLSNVIKTKTGKSVSHWIADRTVTEAKIMLQNPELSIKEIAARLGFIEAPHFSNYFKRNTLISPLEYRKQQVG